MTVGVLGNFAAHVTLVDRTGIYWRYTAPSRRQDFPHPPVRFGSGVPSSSVAVPPSGLTEEERFI